MKTAMLMVLALAACERTSDKYCEQGGTGFGTAACAMHDVDGGSDTPPIDAFECTMDGYDPTECTDATQPICTLSAGTCGPCTSNDQCAGSNVCFLETGECATEDSTAFVNPQFIGTEDPTCTQAAPCKSMAHALTVTSKSHYYLLGTVSDATTFTRDAVVAAAPGMGFVVLTDTTNLSAVQVTGGHAIVSDMVITATGADGGLGLDVTTNGVARAARVKFTTSTVADVKSAGGVTIDQCEFTDGHGLSIVVTGGTYAVTNSLFTQMVGGSVTQPPVQLTGVGTFEFNTIYKLAASTGGRAKGVECSTGGTVAFNIIFGETGSGSAASITSNNCSAHTNLVDKADSGDTAEIVQTGAPFSGTGANESGFVPTAGSQPIQAAVNAQLQGDLSTDHLGVARPSPSGTNADLGAFESPN
ncbi:MAG TPA: hypothetical protein VGM88_22440 [Kofleriaceae bacterium]|jgi:hypothetical protein